MKKLALTLAIVLGLGMASFANNGGGLFGHGQVSPESNTEMTTNGSLFTPALQIHEQSTDQPAPVGSGIAVLVGLGAAYVFAKRREE